MIERSSQGACCRGLRGQSDISLGQVREVGSACVDSRGCFQSLQYSWCPTTICDFNRSMSERKSVPCFPDINSRTGVLQCTVLPFSNKAWANVCVSTCLYTLFYSSPCSELELNKPTKICVRFLRNAFSQSFMTQMRWKTQGQASQEWTCRCTCRTFQCCLPSRLALSN